MELICIFLTFFVVIIGGCSIAKSAMKIKADKLKDEAENIGKTKKIKEYEEFSRHINQLPKIERFILLGLVVLFVVCALVSSIYITGEQEIGFVQTFGQTEIIDTSGVHFKVPFIAEEHIFDATIKGMPIGYTEDTEESQEEDSLMITSDFNFVNIDFYAEYRISDPIEYYYGTKNAVEVLRNILKSSIRNTVGLYTIDDALTTGKAQIEMDVYNDVLNELSKHHTGLSVISVTIQDSEPPNAEVKQAFDAVESERQDADTKKNNAVEYENTNKPAAEATAQEIKSKATAHKKERENQAVEEVANFEALFKQYSKNPDTVKNKLYYDTMQKILPKMDVIIGGDKTVIVKGDKITTK